MRGQVTPAVERAVANAKRWAEQLGIDEAGPRSLLLSLLDESEGQAAQMLVESGVELTNLIQRLQQLPREADDGDIGRLLAEATRLAQERDGELAVQTGHLLLAVIGAHPDFASCLSGAGFQSEAFASKTLPASAEKIALDEPLDFTETPDQIATARILDANLNRAREGLRVVEDYCRFALDDAFLSRTLKEMRHDFLDSLKLLEPQLLLGSRDTIGDVGTSIATMSENQRHSPLHVVRANLKRIQEALRSLEEFGKLIRPEWGSQFEKLRYRTYTIERAILLGVSARERLADARLYLLVTGSACASSIEFVIREAVAGGVDVVQLREKTLSDRDLLERARRVRQWTREAGAIFVVNDRPDIARLVEADGMHLGQDDMPIRDARRIVGSSAIVGVSTHSLRQLEQAIEEGASYVGIGPVFRSHTKAFDEIPGLDFIRHAAKATSLPAFALGGISLENVDRVIAAGARRVAVSSAICRTDEPRPVAAAFRQRLQTR